MKHYIDENSRILDVQLFGQEWAYSEGYVRNAKRVYRKRERAALNRMVEDLVIEELGNDSDYWDAELDDALDKLHSVFEEYAEAEYAFEYYGDEVDWDYYESRFTELRKRVSDAYRELCAVG